MAEAKSSALVTIMKPKAWPRGQERGLNVEAITSRLKAESNVTRPRWRLRPKFWRGGQFRIRASIFTHIRNVRHAHAYAKCAYCCRDHLNSCGVFKDPNGFGWFTYTRLTLEIQIVQMHILKVDGKCDKIIKFHDKNH